MKFIPLLFFKVFLKGHSNISYKGLLLFWHTFVLLTLLENQFAPRIKFPKLSVTQCKNSLHLINSTKDLSG